MDAKQDRAAIYARISLDRTGAGLGVERQVADCRDLAERRGYNVVGVYSDNDVSAYKRRHRPQYVELLELMRAGAVDVVLALHTDRLHRSNAELEVYLDASQIHDVRTETCWAGVIDLSTAMGRFQARLAGSLAVLESEQKAERVRRQKQQAAEQGRANGRLGYGFTWDAPSRTNRVDPAQAAIVCEIADRILRAETLYSIAEDLNLRGVVAPGGTVGTWRSVTIRQTIGRATLAGWREWRPGGYGRRGGHGFGDFIAKGDWAPILSRETVEEIRRLLSDPQRRVSRRQPLTLLTGVLVCGRCGAPMSSAIDRRTGRRKYNCVAQPGLSRCGGVSVVETPVDAMVSAAVVAVLRGTHESEHQVATPSAVATAQRELDQATRALEELSREWAAGALTTTERGAARPVLIARVKAAEAVLIATGARATRVRGLPYGDRADEWWQAANLADRRTVVRALIESVTVLPAARRTNRFDPRRISEPTWRA